MATVRVMTGIRVEYRFVTLVPGSDAGPAVCEANPEDCCVEGSGGGSGAGSGGGQGSGGGGSGGGTACCGGQESVGSPITATVINLSNMACIDGAMATLTWNGLAWEGSTFIDCGMMNSLTLSLVCADGNWNLTYSFGDLCIPPGDVAQSTYSCAPLAVTFDIDTGGLCGATGSPSSFRVTVTE